MSTTTPRDADGAKLCAWCGSEIKQSGVGRSRDYCRRSCRQRAYEALKDAQTNSSSNNNNNNNNNNLGLEDYDIPTTPGENLYFQGTSMAEQMESRPRFSLLNPRDNGLQSTMVRHSTCQSPAECSWEEIFQHQDRLMRLVRRRLPSFQDAEDCVQETMARAAAHAALDRNRLGAFLTSVALRLCIDFYRDMERRSRLLQRAALAETPGTTEEDVCDEDFGRWLLGQVQHLRGREQEVILARAKGISTAEFARIHNISVKAAEAAFTRGRARLKNVCAKALEGCAR